MNQDAFSPVQSALDECIAGRKVLDDVLVVHIVNLDDVVLEIDKQMLIKRQPQGRHHMGDVGLGQGVFAP